MYPPQQTSYTATHQSLIFSKRRAKLKNLLMEPIAATLSGIRLDMIGDQSDEAAWCGHFAASDLG
jgi:hypothetical protein